MPGEDIAVAAGSRAFLERLRTQGGPSHDLLVLLDAHRVLTTDQLARATGTPVRTARYRLSQLQEHGLVDEHRPGREVGSAPSHWWLRPAGARLVSGTATHARPSAMFAAHSAAIGEAWLAVRDHGPDTGVELQDWATDRAGWQEWEPSTLYGDARLRRLTPDAVLRARVVLGDVAGDAIAFVEVDLASMTQTQLREKLSRYLQYAADRAWVGRFPHCPPMLLLTTTEARATGYIRAARRVLAGEQPGRPYSRADADLAAADRLVVAACGLVRDPARAVVEPVWLLPEQAAADLTLAELLAERVETQARAHAWRVAIAARQKEHARADVVAEIARRDVADLAVLLLGDVAAAEALDLLVGAPGFLEREPELARAVIVWWRPRPQLHSAPGRAPVELVDALRARHRSLWARHTRRVLEAEAHIVADDPGLAAAAARLQAGRLLRPADRFRLDAEPKSRREMQAAALVEHTARRAAAVAREHQALPWLTRRRTDPVDLADAYDERHLLVCDLCAMAVPRRDPDREVWDGDEEGDGCRVCHDGHLIDYAHRGQVPTLAQRLDQLREVASRADQ